MIRIATNVVLRRSVLGVAALAAVFSLCLSAAQLRAQPPNCADYVCGEASDCLRVDQKCNACTETGPGTKRCGTQA